MSYYNKYGRAEVDSENPRAFGVCDRCGIWHNLHKLSWQFQWNATKLYNTRFLVCDGCLDTPQEQLRTIILPPDPPALSNVRIGNNPADYIDVLATQTSIDIETEDDLLIVANDASQNASEAPEED